MGGAEAVQEVVAGQAGRPGAAIRADIEVGKDRRGPGIVELAGA